MKKTETTIQNKQKANKNRWFSKIIKFLQKEQKYTQQEMDKDPLRLMEGKSYFCMGKNPWDCY